MSEPVSAGFISVSTVGGITVLGVVTGLHPALMLAGAAGGWWAMTYHDRPTSVWGRLNSIFISSVVAAWGAPVAVAWSSYLLPEGSSVSQLAVDLLAALIIGLSTIEVLGRGILSVMRGVLSFVRKFASKGEEGQ